MSKKGLLQRARLLDYLPVRYTSPRSGISHVLADGEGRSSLVDSSVVEGKPLKVLDAEERMEKCRLREDDKFVCETFSFYVSSKTEGEPNCLFCLYANQRGNVTSCAREMCEVVFDVGYPDGILTPEWGPFVMENYLTREEMGVLLQAQADYRQKEGASRTITLKEIQWKLKSSKDVERQTGLEIEGTTSFMTVALAIILALSFIICMMQVAHICRKAKVPLGTTITRAVGQGMEKLDGKTVKQQTETLETVAR